MLPRPGGGRPSARSRQPHRSAPFMLSAHWGASAGAEIDAEAKRSPSCAGCCGSPGFPCLRCCRFRLTASRPGCRCASPLDRRGRRWDDDDLGTDGRGEDAMAAAVTEVNQPEDAPRMRWRARRRAVMRRLRPWDAKAARRSSAAARWYSARRGASAACSSTRQQRGRWMRTYLRAGNPYGSDRGIGGFRSSIERQRPRDSAQLLPAESSSRRDLADRDRGSSVFVEAKASYGRRWAAS